MVVRSFLLSVLQQSANGLVKRLGGFDDIVVLPEGGVAKKIDLVVEQVALVERVASLDGLHVTA